MDLVFIILLLIYSTAIAIGVGSSTIAIAGFLTAIADGNFDESERRIMGVVYIVLRVAMVLIVLSSLAVVWLQPGFFGAFTVPLSVLVAVLYVNAFLMTKHWISGKLGPAIQAGTWYSLGFLTTIYVFGLAAITTTVFLSLYITALVFAVLIVNFFLKNAKP